LNKPIFLVIGILSVGIILGFSFAVSAEENLIPSWIKTTAGFWVDDQISDTEFISALQFLVKEGILVIPTSEVETTETKEPYINELDQYALEIVNEDRAKHGVQPVRLSHLKTAQAHADDMLELDYFSHWDSDNLKPYSAYTKMGGRGDVSENIAITETYCPAIPCISSSFNVKKQINDHQYGMMYDDADSDWGHRDNIISRDHTHVNFGIAYDEDDLYFVQHFENNILI